MSSERSPLLGADDLTLLPDAEYGRYVLAAVRSARCSIDFTQFVANAHPADDDDGDIRFVGHALANAAWRGVQVRGVLAQVALAETGFDGNYPFARFLSSRGVRIRTYRPTNRSLHAKLLLIDDEMMIVGGHNWTPQAFHTNHELSIALHSHDLVSHGSMIFERYWDAAEEVTDEPRSSLI